MKKKLFMVFLIGGCVSIFTGCSNESKYTEEEETVISDYMAQMVFKHCEGFDYKLVNVSDNPFIREEEDIDQSEKEEKNLKSDDSIKTGSVDDKISDKEDNEIKKEKVDLANVLGFSNDINAEVKKITFYNEYTEDAYVIEAEQGKMLLKVDFILTNKSNKKIKVTNSSDAKIAVIIEGEKYKPLMTAMKNDLLFFSRTIKSKNSESATLIFSVPKSAKKDNMKLEVTSNDGGALIQLE